jgi:hypothetical protein
MANSRRRIEILSLTALVLVGLFVALQSAGAQSPPAAPPWLQMTVVQVDPAFIDEYLAMQRDITARLRRAQGATWRTVHRSDVFGDTYQFMTVTPVQTLASFDAAGRNVDAELTALNIRAQKYVKTQHSYGIRTIPELDNPLAQNQAPTMMLVNIARVVPGKEQDYLNLMKSDFLPHYTKAEYRHTNGIVTFGGPSGFIHMFYINNFAKLDEGSPVVRALGIPAAQGASAKFAGLVTSEEKWVARLVPDLSFGPWSTPNRPPQD